MKHQSQDPIEGLHSGSNDQTENGLESFDLVIDPIEVEKHIAAARRLRAEATASMIKALFSRLFAFQGKGAKPKESSSPRNNQALPV